MRVELQDVPCVESSAAAERFGISATKTWDPPLEDASMGRGRVRACVRACVEDASYIGMEAVVRLVRTWARSSGCRGIGRIGPERKGQGRPRGLEEACPALVQRWNPSREIQQSELVIREQILTEPSLLL